MVRATQRRSAPPPIAAPVTPKLKKKGLARAAVHPEQSRGTVGTPSSFQRASGTHPRAEPKLTKEAAADQVVWKEIEGGKLFIDGVSHDAITQGSAGDCFFLSALSSIAWDRPSAIHDMVKTNDDATFTVRFFQKSRKGPPKAVFITVDDKLPVGKDGPEYATDRDPKELWPAIIEKAYASWKGGYDKINEGGDAGDAMFSICGKKADYTEKISQTNRDTLFATLQAAAREHRSMVTGTYDEKQQPVKYDDVGLVEGHDYTILNAFVRGGERFVKLRNPWGATGWKKDEDPHDTDNGTFTMKYSDFRKMFEDLSVLKEAP